MMVNLSSLFVGLLAAAPALAHMEMAWPPALRNKGNKFTTNPDYDYVSPLAASGANFPCKGHHSVLGTPQGQVVATWSQGGVYNMTIQGSAVHGGGSCQASLSYDQGRTFTAIKTWIGNCPIQGSGTWSFTVPGDAPVGDALFAWSWFNRIGAREMYMNCASVSVKPGSGSGAASTPWAKRPEIFKANIGNGCATLEMKDVMIPNPGPDVVLAGNPTTDPVGNCGPKAPPVLIVSTSASTKPAASSSNSSTKPATSSTKSATTSKAAAPSPPPATTTKVPPTPPCLKDPAVQKAIAEAYTRGLVAGGYAHSKSAAAAAAAAATGAARHRRARHARSH